EYRAETPESDSPSLHLVQFAGPVTADWKARLESRADILAYIPHSAYIVRATAADLAAIASASEVRWTGAYQPWYKMEPRLLTETSIDPVARVLVDLQPFTTSTDLRAVIALLSPERVERSESNLLVIGSAHRDALPALAKLDSVAWVQRYHDGEFYNGPAQWVVQSGQNGQRPVWDKGLHGEGQVVGYGDTGLDYDHIFFRDPTNPIGPSHRKVVGYKQWAANPGDTMGHGTHVAGSIAGNDKPLSGTSANVGQGYEAKLFVDDVSNTGSDWSAPADLTVFYQESYNASARLHSNSWGYPSEHTYTKAASTTDQWMWSHKDDGLVIIAAGNERGSGANSLRSPGLSKNIVTVGATENGANHQNMASFSSIGPTNPDGRLKPTVCAPGSGIMSADSDGDLGSNNAGEIQMSGTSMATPTTAGTLSTMRQYFTEGWYPGGVKNAADAFVPTGALLKAVLMAGAKEITGTGSDYSNENVYPNNSQGWGIVNSDNSLYFSGETQRLAVWEEKTGVNTGETKTYTFDVSSDTQMLRVILVWTDYYGAVNANPAIVNDLDLEVTDPTGTKYLGNNFQGKNPGHSVTGGAPDRKNVEEGVLIPTAAFGLKTGKWSILVRGQNAPQGPQPFAIAVTGDVRGGGSGSSLSRIDVAPQAATITADQTQQFTATAFDVNGNQTNATFTWNSSGGSVDTTGLYTAGPVGAFQVRASAGGKVGVANVTVTPGALVSVLVVPTPVNVSAGGTQVFGAQGRDAKGNSFLIQVNWSSSIGTIDANGSFTAPTTLGTGTVTATDRATGKQGTATVNVVAGPVAKLEVAPQGATVPADQTLQFTANGFDQHGNPTKASPTWSVTSGAVDVAGLFTPDKIGVQTVTAREGAASATAQVTVVPGKMASIKVEPLFSSITADETAK
ncbi:MAG TPA: S8 family serine peptidase, partial [Thermoplasmata archaeon]|nr:S8 family serine peptidase [Thermoplasmata archaeon]